VTVEPPLHEEPIDLYLYWRSIVFVTDRPQRTAARELISAVITQARLKNQKSVLADANGTLGWLYEQDRQWSDAIEFTRQALSLTTAPGNDTRYRWEWQLGRILQHQSQPDFGQAKAAYDRAVAALEQTRRNVRVINPDAQFSLRDRIEPLYRELVDLCLRLPQPNLAEIIDRVDALKIAELENFLQCQLGEYRSVFVMDGVLQNIPVAALYDRSRREYLIERYPVAVTPGLKILGAKHSVENRSNILIGGLTTPTTSTTTGSSKRRGIDTPLIYAASEIQSIESLFPRATKLVGKNFTRRGRDVGKPRRFIARRNDDTSGFNRLQNLSLTKLTHDADR
jgi:tetratricopeptide (TPR) repeat protein